MTLYPYGLVSRHGMPHVQGFYILHEGLIGVVDGSLKEIGYQKALENPPNADQGDVRLARHHRQILGGGRGAARKARRSKRASAARPAPPAPSASRPTI